MDQIAETIREKALLWANADCFSAETRKEITALIAANNVEELNDRFYKDLGFGTGGLRGIIGNGSNRMNVYNIRKATQGLANYINRITNENAPQAKSPAVAIAYDSRRYSDLFARETAAVLRANEITVYLYKELRPVPMLSFAIRETGSIAGVCITASHNPKEYNGYKVYWQDGAQITPPHDRGIIAEVNAITAFDQIKIDHEASVVDLGCEMDEAYFQAIAKQRIHENYDRALKIVYSPLHGSGNLPVRQGLKQWGFHDVNIVPEQENPDPNFSTVSYPNPEEPDALDMAVALAKNINADIVFATDPDCDRLAVVAAAAPNRYHYLNGNQVGALLLHYVLTGLQAQGRLPKNALAVSTIVSSDLGRKIAESHDVTYETTLTGFKYIGEKIRLKQDEEKVNTFVYGYEESYGYLIGDHARDKDAVIAAIIVAEMAAYYKLQGKTLVSELDALYQQHGYHTEALTTRTLTGQAGAEKIETIMATLRHTPPAMLLDYRLTAVKDYAAQQQTDINTGAKTAIDLPTSNVLTFIYGDHFTVTVRPSGTEPKIKIYYQCMSRDKKQSESLIHDLQRVFAGFINCK